MVKLYLTTHTSTAFADFHEGRHTFIYTILKYLLKCSITTVKYHNITTI